MLIQPGLVSVSFRRLSPERIVAAAAEAGLRGIEWGGDVHAPHGATEIARNVRDLTRDAGLQVAAYGSYYRAGVSDSQNPPFEKALATAIALEAPTIRVWAGNTASADCSPEDKARIIDDSLRIARMAAGEGVDIAFEYHARTLTDTTGSALELMRATGDAGLKVYWQPSVGLSEERHRESLREMLPWLDNLHVYKWIGKGERRPLAEGADEWRRFFSIAAESPLPRERERWALLEFFKNDSVEQFQEDARTLLALLAPASRAG